MEKLSLLVFSRNDIDKALALIDDMYSHVDEIVLVDSSESREHRRLLKEKSSRKLEKLRIFYSVAFGYPDPLRMYAIKKCRYRWIMLIDTDERISPGLKRDLRKILANAQSSAFAFKRYEEVSRKGRGTYFNWQIRLFLKDKTEFRGMLHEEPIIKGKVARLADDDYFMDHIIEIKGNSSMEYYKMMKFMRMSYGSFNERMVEGFYKFTMPDYRTDKTASAGWIYRILTGYEILKRKTPGEELSYFDYWLYYKLYSLAISMRTKRLTSATNEKPNLDAGEVDLLKEIEKWKHEPDGKEVFEISKILHNVGLIRFLDLEKDSTIAYLNKKYSGKKQGVELLMKLLKERYEKDYKGVHT